MGKLVIFPCRDYYEEYENYYSEEFEEQDYGEDCLVKDGLDKGFVRRCLMFILVRLFWF